ncbi:MAG: MFS transporter [Acidobacteria bacterium]|nr:MAG: MFS transporter [Acidobacteriota bacterium]
MELNRSNQRNAVMAGFLGWMLDAFDFFIVTLVINDLAKAFGETRTRIAFASSMTLMMRPFGAIIFGVMADRFGRKLPLMLNVIMYASVSVACAFAPNYTVFLVLRMIFGIAMGGEWGLGASLALESVSPRYRGLISGLLQEGYAAGALLASLVYRFVYPDFGWRPLFLIGGLPALLAIFIRAKVKESPAWHEHKTTDWASYGRAITSNWKRFAFLVLMMTMMNFISHGTQDMYPTFLEQHRGFLPIERANTTMIAYLGAIIGGLAFGWYSDHTSRKRAMVTGLICCFLFTPLWIAAPTALWLTVGAFMMQFFVQGAWGQVPAHINELSPNAIRGFFPGFAYQLGVAASSLFPYVQAVVGERFSYAWSMGILAATVFAAGAIVITLGPEAKGVSFRKH